MYVPPKPQEEILLDAFSNEKHVHLSTSPQPFSSTSSYFIELSNQCLILPKNLLNPLTRIEDATILHSPHPEKGKQNALQPFNPAELNSHYFLYLTNDIQSLGLILKHRLSH